MSRKLGKQRLAELAAKFPLTDQEKTDIQATADAIWGEVAYDCLEGNEKKTVSREVVLEIVMDAGRLEERLERYGDFKKSSNIKALFPVGYDRDASDYLYHLLKQRFTYMRYGL